MEGSGMIDNTIQETTSENWKSKVLILGGALGALVGVLSAYLFIQNRNTEDMSKVSAGEGVKLGVLVLALLRGIASLGEGK
jgi:hypothetical protein